ncbi:MAG: amidohydrolase [Anaerolineaceae bacterium]|nr:amidohydrolase [Anaerolineaceae bacterium]
MIEHKQLLDEANQLFGFSQEIRRDLHRHPELGFNEFRTSKKIVEVLNSLGLETQSGIAKTGVVATIEGNEPGPVILLRFDMDALPIQEMNSTDYASQTPGVMHACGHDGHVSIGLTVAKILTAHRDELRGSIKLMFQPAEEGQGGADVMIQEGVLENPKPDYALALHIWNEKPLGWMGISAGPMMAAADIFEVKINGKGGHGALPDQSYDPIVASAQIVLGLQTIVSRNVSPLEPAVVSITQISGGETYNVIPAQVSMKGTIRTYSKAVRDSVVERFRLIVDKTAETHQCQAEINISVLSSAVVNSDDTTRLVQSTAAKLYPMENIDTSFRTMGSEDMASVLELVPGCYFMVGSANAADGLDYKHHHPRFDFDESVLPKGAAMIAGAALEIMGILR